MKNPIDWTRIKSELDSTRQRLARGWEGDSAKSNKILNQRAAKLAGRACSRDTKGAGVDCLVFALGSEKFAFELGSVLEVVSLGQVTRVPGAPPEYHGIVNHRGTVLPVFHLDRLLGKSTYVTEIDRLKFAVVLRSPNLPWAVAVEAVLPNQALSASGTGIEDLPFGKFSKSISPERVVLLDTSAIVRHPLIGGGSLGKEI